MRLAFLFLSPLEAAHALTLVVAMAGSHTKGGFHSSSHNGKDTTKKLCFTIYLGCFMYAQRFELRGIDG